MVLGMNNKASKCSINVRSNTATRDTRRIEQTTNISQELLTIFIKNSSSWDCLISNDFSANVP